MTVHDFTRSLDYSHDQSDGAYWHEVYRQAFPDMRDIVDLRHNGWHQRAGRDRAIVLSTGRTLYVDEKARDCTYSDILLEIWSVYPHDGEPPYDPRANAVPGWAAKPLDCDYLAYAFVPTQTCHLFPFFGIRAAWEKHRVKWLHKATDETRGYRWVVASNRRVNGSTYKTVSIAVPIPALRDAIADSMTVKWTAEPSQQQVESDDGDVPF
jgi:hypothetical protein